MLMLAKSNQEREFYISLDKERRNSDGNVVRKVVFQYHAEFFIQIFSFINKLGSLYFSHVVENTEDIHSIHLLFLQNKMRH